MVDRADAQFYTMEGIAAAVLMVLTAYLVLGGTTIYTPGDTHIIDMQLEQVGNDALKILDTRNTNNEDFSLLESYVRNMTETSSQVFFIQNFTEVITKSIYIPDKIQFKADIFYLNKTGDIKQYPFVESDRKFAGNENAIRITRWIYVDKSAPHVPTDFFGPFSENKTVLLEVLLWRN